MAAQLQRTATLHALQGTSNQSMWWSIAGLVVCCLPLAVVGFVQGVRARGLARTLGAPLPAQALTGLVLSAMGGLASVAFVTFAILSNNEDKAAADARIQVLEAQTNVPALAAGLTQPTACGLAEAYALKTGVPGHAGPTLAHFECLGRIAVTGDRADLENFRFRHGSSNGVLDRHVCFKRGARWFVTSLQDAPCSAP